MKNENNGSRVQYWILKLHGEVAIYINSLDVNGIGKGKIKTIHHQSLLSTLLLLLPIQIYSFFFLLKLWCIGGGCELQVCQKKMRNARRGRMNVERMPKSTTFYYMKSYKIYIKEFCSNVVFARLFSWKAAPTQS